MPNSGAPPKLSPKLVKSFEYFVNTSNKSMGHPNDWGKFYEFIAQSHSLRSRLKESDVKRLLVQEGFKEEYAIHLADVYQHGRELIRVYKGTIPQELLDHHRAKVKKLMEPEGNHG